MALNPYVFAGGCYRSGTTLLQRILNHHPMLAMGNDTHFVLQCLPSETISDPPLTPALVECARRHPRFAKLGLDAEAVDRASEEARTYGEFVSAIYTALASAQGKPLAGEKTPRYVQHIATLDPLFPWVKWVHIIRDGRDVALSLLDWARPDRGPGRFALWEEEPVAVAALSWRERVLRGRDGGASLPADRYHEVRYEALVTRPRETVADLLSFLDLPFSEDALDYHRGRSPRKPDSNRGAWLPPTPGLRDWRTQMRPRDEELFEAIAGDLLEELGYERRHTAISADVAAVAERCRRWWESPHRERRLSQGTEEVPPAPTRPAEDGVALA